MREREKKEKEWERELQLAMEASDPLNEIPPSVSSKKIAPNEEKQHGKHHKRTHAHQKNEEKGPKGLDNPNKLQNIDYIDRTPSPIERLDAT